MEIPNITSGFFRFCFFRSSIVCLFFMVFFVCLKTEGSFRCQACFLNIVKITSSTKNYHQKLTFVDFDYITPCVCWDLWEEELPEIFSTMQLVKIVITYQKRRSREVMSYRRCSKSTIKK